MWNYLKKIIIIPILILSFFVNPIEVFGATFGTTTNGGSTIGFSLDRVVLSAGIASSAGTLNSGKTRVWISSGTVNSRMVIYSDSSGPNNLLAVSDEVALVNTTEQEISYTFSGLNQIPIESSTTYWVGIHIDTSALSGTVSQQSCATTRYIITDDYSDGASSVFDIGSASTSASLCIDSYGEYTVNENLGQTHFFINPNLVKSGLYLDFDGVDERGQTGANPTGNTDTSGSVSCWVTPDTVLAVNGSRHLFGMGGDDTDQATNFGRFFINMRFVSGTYNNRVEMFHAIDNSATINRVIGNTELSAGNLYNIVVTSSGTAWKIYVNGTDQTLTTVSGSNTGDWFGDIGTVGNRRYSIGAFYRDGVYASGTYWDGKVDNCTVFSTTLSQTEVTNLYNSGKVMHPCAVITCSSLDTFWKMGEDANGTVTTMHSAIGTPSTDNFTMENMENADIISASYY